MKTITQITGASIAALLFSFTGCSKMDETSTGDSGKNATKEMMKENGNNPDEAVFRNSSKMRSSIYVYTESNDSGNNSVLIYKRNGAGDLELVGTEASGGAGNALGLGSQGALTLDADHKFLYAVNAGSNSISSFRVLPNGNLMLKQTINSQGITPVSLAIHEDILYVVHSGDGTINGFHLGPNGTFSHIAGSHKNLSSAMAGPAEIAFSPNGNHLYVTEKMTNTISTFSVNNAGVAGSRVSTPSVGNTPFGFDFARDQYMIVSNADGGTANLSSVTSYSGVNSGNLAAVNGAIPNNQTAACWVATTMYGRYAFISNTGSDDVSSYYVGAGGNLSIIEENIPSGDSPIDLVVASDNYSVYVLCAMDHTIQQYKRTELGGLTHTGIVHSLPVHAAGLATW
ncbi:MAG: beta-propeller fold lactonase family protein [Flavobacterium sp.]|uniref:lactonase family protein n=1 Tax=Flavobacterium sp. TaxID=239 RepID=UPI0032640C7D